VEPNKPGGRQVRYTLTLLQTFAGFGVGGGLIAAAADALVCSLAVDTAAVQADPGENTLVHIWSGSETKTKQKKKIKRRVS